VTLSGPSGPSAFEQPPHFDAEVILRRVGEIISNAKSMPLSNSVIVSKDEVLELLEDAVSRLPDELRQARWMLKEREEFLAKVEREADEILDAARIRAERMVQRTEIVREAHHVASRTVEHARDQARRLRLESEDYCDQKLAAFEIVLERTMKTVQAGREKLAATPLPPAEELGLAGMVAAGPGAEMGPGPDDAFFDQDRA
jgi:argininosuccinate lyase